MNCGPLCSRCSEALSHLARETKSLQLLRGPHHSSLTPSAGPSLWGLLLNTAWLFCSYSGVPTTGPLLWLSVLSKTQFSQAHACFTPSLSLRLLFGSDLLYARPIVTITSDHKRTYWLKTTQIYYPTLTQIRIPERVGRAAFLLKADNLFSWPFPVSRGHPCVLAHGCITHPSRPFSSLNHCLNQQSLNLLSFSTEATDPSIPMPNEDNTRKNVAQSHLHRCKTHK